MVFALSVKAVIVTVSVNVSVVTGIVSTDVMTPPPVTSCGITGV